MGIKFSEEALNDLSVLEAAVQDIVNRTVDAFQKCDTYAAGKNRAAGAGSWTAWCAVKTRHIARLQAGVCTIEYGFVLDDLLTNYERIADHCSEHCGGHDRGRGGQVRHPRVPEQRQAWRQREV